MNKRARFLISGTVVMLSLAVMPGCKWITDLFKKKGEEKVKKDVKTARAKSGPVLLSINGEKVIWESDFKKSLTQMLQANPYFRGAGIDALPTSIKRKFFDELIKQELILRDAERSGVDEKADFVKAYKELKRLAKRSLVIQFYEKQIYDTIKVSENEKNKHFNENKDRFVKTPGGVLVSGVQFNSEKDADELIADVKASKILDNAKEFLKEFDTMAKEDKEGTFKNFGRVEEKSRGFGDTTPAPIRESVYALRSYPQVEKVKVGKDFWVIAAADKKETVYFKKEEIDSQLTNMLKNNKFREELDEKLKTLKAGTKVEVNEPYFEDKNEKKSVAASGIVQQKSKSGVKIVKGDAKKKAAVKTA